MPNETILVIEDEIHTLELLKTVLEAEQYDVITATSAEDALELLKSYLPDLILLDLILPGTHGLNLCKILKSNPTYISIPIVILTAQGLDDDIVNGLESGADDYIVKSGSHKVLISRIRAVLRRNPKTLSNNSSVIKIQNLLIDQKRYKAFLNDKPLDLSTSEYKLLHFLISKPGWVFTRNQILESLREDDIVNDRSIDVLIVGLRKKLGILAKNIQTIRGIGYSFEESFLNGD